MSTPSDTDLSGLDHEKLMRRAIDLAASARKNGNKPFGALLTDLDGNIVLEAENTEIEDSDATSHAEANLISKASKLFSKDELAKLVMYASCEPCAMCTGATFFAGVRSVVFGLSAETLSPMWITESIPDPALLNLSCRAIFETCKGHPTTVIGPILEEEAIRPHLGFWN
jgi:tRNA(Arg) A34 adenosine deaminase TadA